MNHLDIVLSFHLQKKIGGFAQKWPNYSVFFAATWNFFDGPIYITTFGVNHFWGPMAPQAENLGGGGQTPSPLPLVPQKVKNGPKIAHWGSKKSKMSPELSQIQKLELKES